jgi:rubrerythrin
MTAYLVTAALACAGLAIVFVPLRRGPRREPAASTDLYSDRKDSLLDGLLDLEEERELGKLSQSDFEGLRKRYEAEVLVALDEAEAHKSSGARDHALELEVARMRRELSCPTCGTPLGKRGECPRCGG